MVEWSLSPAYRPLAAVESEISPPSESRDVRQVGKGCQSSKDTGSVSAWSLITLLRVAAHHLQVDYPADDLAAVRGLPSVSFGRRRCRSRSTIGLPVKSFPFDKIGKYKESRAVSGHPVS